jgi:manganese peroxidase
MVDQEAHMMSAFAAAMAKVAVLGQKKRDLIDCSDVIPIPKPFTGKAHLPAGSKLKDIQVSVGTEILNTAGDMLTKEC